MFIRSKQARRGKTGDLSLLERREAQVVHEAPEDQDQVVSHGGGEMEAHGECVIWPSSGKKNCFRRFLGGLGLKMWRSSCEAGPGKKPQM
eukprot:symbB.v1.2.030684.t1/scaffold3470.1/size56093/1